MKKCALDAIRTFYSCHPEHIHYVSVNSAKGLGVVWDYL